MDTESILFYVFGVVSTFYVIHLGFYLTGANFYDIWQFRRKFKKKWQTTSLNDYHPLVTVAIPAHNEEKVIVRCLESVRKSSYPHLQVLVIDDASTDNTSKIVRDYIRLNPGMNLRLISKKKNGGKAHGLNYALKHYAQGRFAMTLDADSIIGKDTIINAIAYFDDPNVAGVAANVQIIEEPTILGILQKFEHMIGYRSKKVYSLTNCEFVVGGVASTYRMNVLRKVKFYDTDTMTEDIGLSLKIISSAGNRANKMVYGADVTAKTEGVDSFRALVKQRYRWKYGCLQNLIKYYKIIGNPNMQFSFMLTLYRMPMAVLSELVLLLTPIVWLYTLYFSLAHSSLLLLMGAYLTITTYILITLWSDEHLKVSERLRMTLYAPIAYFMFYIMDVVQLVAITRCTVKAGKLVSQKNVGSAWVSPRRIGREVAAG